MKNLYPIIRAIELDRSYHQHFDDYSVVTNSPKNILDNLSKINIFVGSNNSGKSRFMRSIACIDDLRFSPNLDVETINKLKTDIAQSVEQAINLHNSGYHNVHITHVTGLSNANLERKDEYFFSESMDYLADIDAVMSSIFDSEQIQYLSGNSQYNDTRITQPLRSGLSKEKQTFDELREKYPKRGFHFNKLYIPMLRGLRPLQSDKDLYKDRTSEDYFKDKKKPSVFTGLTLYQRVQELLLGDLYERETVKEFQDFLSDTFFEGESVALIPRKLKDVLFVKVGNEEEFPIHEVGDGIQAVIVMTFPLFENRDMPSLVFIEEPEVHLHPGLQRVFINTLMTYFEKHQFFITTHSNHFLDMTLDYSNISIFTFEKKIEDKSIRNAKGKFEIANVSNADTKPLELLGVKNSCVFLSNCTIWVEGITDRRYLSHYLNLYMEQEEASLRRFKEDLHFSFVEYSGGNITHWSFLDEEKGIVVDRLCGKLFLITDKDDDEDKAKTERQAKLKKILKERYYCLSCREIENLLSPEVLKKVIEEFVGSSVKFDYKYEDYKNVYLGSFIEEKVGKKKMGGKFAEKSGTITKKVIFCDKAISHIKSFDDLTKDAQELTKKLYKFIQGNNHK